MIDKEKEKLSFSPGNSGKYGAKAIKVLEGLDAVRKRPAMYIGSTSLSGLHHLVYEVVDNSVDEALAGICSKIKVILHKDGSCSVLDNGRGIPVDKHPTEKISAAEVVLTKLHAGGKFDKDSYKYSGGLHGVGISVVNALSEDLEVKIYRDNKIYQQFYKKGKPQSPLKEVGEIELNGTYIKFKPDSSIFEVTDFNFDVLSARFRELSFLNKGLKIEINDERTEQSHSYLFEGGIASFVKHVNTKKTPLFKEVIELSKEDDVYVVDFACQYNDGYSEQTFSFVNNIRTVEGGTHEAGFKSALTKACNKFAQKTNLLKDGNLSSDDVREGLVAVLSIKVPEPQFEGQTKTKLGNAEVKGVVDSWLYSFFTEYFEENPTIGKKIIQKALLAQQARSAAKKARELTRRKTALESSVLPGKLADCSNDNPASTELYIVEGDSAGGCFSGETKVALVDGRNLSFKDLVKEHLERKQNYCYTITKNGSIDIAPIKHPRITKTNAKVIKIVLDSDEEIACTPDHLFMLRDGSYKNAEELKTKDSLMPLYKSEDKELILDPKKLKYICSKTLKNSSITTNTSSLTFFHNHKIKKIVSINKKIDVYDIEVDKTHNFALSSGVFVHNSAKQARDRHTQAILPLRGKIINVEKARLDRMLNNNEIKDLITAIGAGIGNEEFDSTKARYHKIIIMTDADVDGSHIRILLLTFFFRHMLPLIESGYLYIAQPPLYKVKVGRESRYLKDDSELTGFLFDWAAGSTELKINNHNFSGDNWNKQLENILKYNRELEKLSRILEVGPKFCHELALFLKEIQWEKDKYDLQTTVDKLKEYFSKYEISGLEEENNEDELALEGDVAPKAILTFKHLKRTWELPTKFFGMEESGVLLDLLRHIELSEKEQWILSHTGKELKKEGLGLISLCDTIIKTGKSLMTIQRYKGLGEMNPDQLWETTMDPKTRSLLKVNIEDAIAADQWFTALMGDVVEDRKEYIAKHAHFVKNLDV
ncbi:DNA topoisomerase (ATP-hydrolyzing) subunit B [Candidatus Babeliales bacterium]|nr:DNA topoisomerase (ATP-hydrolyzing) subunit B [Candidatus Babeliales bacterium]